MLFFIELKNIFSEICMYSVKCNIHFNNYNLKVVFVNMDFERTKNLKNSIEKK